MTSLTITAETWSIAGRFTISRGSKTNAHVVIAELNDGQVTGRGEAVPYDRYGETMAAVMATLEDCRQAVAAGLSRADLQHALPPGAARNALDCAFWDLQAKQTGCPVWKLAELAPPAPVVTALTLSLESPDEMAKAAGKAKLNPLLKLKLAGDDADLARIAAVANAAPTARLILDANESWSFDQLRDHAHALRDYNIVLIEQPLKAGEDDALLDYTSPIPLCADESIHDLASFEPVKARYDAINIKLDKTGGLTHAIALAQAARAHGLMLMVGCMVSTSLAMAPALMIAGLADVVDLDGPLLLAKDREPGLHYHGTIIDPPTPDLWG